MRGRAAGIDPQNCRHLETAAGHLDGAVKELRGRRAALHIGQARQPALSCRERGDVQHDMGYYSPAAQTSATNFACAAATTGVL